MTEIDRHDSCSTEDVLSEVQRRHQVAHPMSERERRIVIIADHLIFWLTHHWLAVLNLVAVLYVGLPVLAPLFLYLDLRLPARIIYAIYQPLCHQLPQRSWFLFGSQAAYRLGELAELLGEGAAPGPFQGAFVGTHELGYKMALCQRCTAIYGMIALSGIVYSGLRQRMKVPPMPLWAYGLVGVLPMLIDGGWQWVSYAVSILLPQLPVSPHETTPLMRTITGVLFGLSTVWLAYPYVQEAMDEFRVTLQQKFGWV